MDEQRVVGMLRPRGPQPQHFILAALVAVEKGERSPRVFCYPAICHLTSCSPWQFLAVSLNSWVLSLLTMPRN